jgi:hypothetical protein
VRVRVSIQDAPLILFRHFLLKEKSPGGGFELDPINKTC